MHSFSKFILLQNSTCFGHLPCPSSGVSTVPLALVSFMQVSDDRFQTESGLRLEAVIRNLNETYQRRIYSRKHLMMGREDARNM